MIQRVSNQDMVNLAKQIGTKTGDLALVLNGLFTSGIFLCQVVPDQPAEMEPLQASVEAPSEPYKAHETDQEYFSPSNDLGSLLGPQLQDHVPNEYR